MNVTPGGGEKRYLKFVKIKASTGSNATLV
jgi:hypothetical protein